MSDRHIGYGITLRMMIDGERRTPEMMPREAVDVALARIRDGKVSLMVEVEKYVDGLAAARYFHHVEPDDGWVVDDEVHLLVLPVGWEEQDREYQVALVHSLIDTINNMVEVLGFLREHPEMVEPMLDDVFAIFRRLGDGGVA